MSCERDNPTVKVIKNDQEWLNLSLARGLSEKEASCIHGFWSTVPLENPWVWTSEEIYIYINEAGMKNYGFPPEGIKCKIAHEVTEAWLCQEKITRLEAHVRACKVELEMAKRLNILNSYVIAELKVCLKYGLFEEAWRKTLIYLEIKGQS